MKGFSLVEILITTVIFTIIVGGFYGLLNAGNKFYATDMAFMELQQNARNGMDRVTREVRASSAASVTVVDTNSDTLTFTTPTATNAKYYRNGSSQLIREYPSGTLKIIASNITRFKFTLTAPLLKIDLTANQTALLQSFSVNLIEKVRLRNE